MASFADKLARHAAEREARRLPSKPPPPPAKNEAIPAPPTPPAPPPAHEKAAALEALEGLRGKLGGQVERASAHFQAGGEGPVEAGRGVPSLGDDAVEALRRRAARKLALGDVEARRREAIAQFREQRGGWVSLADEELLREVDSQSGEGLDDPEALSRGVAAWCPGAERASAPSGMCARVQIDLPAARTQPPERELVLGGWECPPPRVPSAPWRPEAASILFGDPRVAGLSLDRILFLDTETTGLGRDAATFAFLVGVGWYDATLERFVVQQLLMEDFDEEPAQLDLLEELASRFDALCTYNGKSFDTPLLDNRLMFNRRSTRLGRMVQLDLLPPARRLWRDMAGGASLQKIERAVLGRARGLDLPGHLIPQVFRDYARGANRGRMRFALHHNLLDVVSMADILDEALAAVDPGPGMRDVASAAALGGAPTLRGLARLYAARGRHELGHAALRAAAERADSAAQRRACLEGAAEALKRSRLHAEADAAWEQLADEGGASAEALRALIEMAKHREHRLRDWALALRVCRRASALQETMETLGALEHVPLPQRVRWAEDLARREVRLAKRIDAARERAERSKRVQVADESE